MEFLWLEIEEETWEVWIVFTEYSLLHLAMNFMKLYRIMRKAARYYKCGYIYRLAFQVSDYITNQL